MTEQHLTFRQFEDYAARRLGPEEIAAFHEHTGNCPDCRRILIATTTAEHTDHITEQQAVDYAAGKRSDAVAGHIETCDSCRSVVADLSEFRRTLEPHRSSTVWLMPLAATLLLAVGVTWFIRHGHPEPAVIAELRDAGGTFQVTPENLLRNGAPLPAGADVIISNALRTGHLPAGPAELPSAVRGTLRSENPPSAAPAIEIVSPDGVRVLSDRPEFHWRQTGSGAPVEIQVFDENFNEIARSGPLHDSAWIPAAPLPRSKPLLWQVTQIRNGARVTAPAPPEAPARFEIISEDAAQRIAAAQATHPPSHLLLAILYSQAGLRKEAAFELAALSKLNPGSPLAASLLKR